MPQGKKPPARINNKKKNKAGKAGAAPESVSGGGGHSSSTSSRTVLDEINRNDFAWDDQPKRSNQPSFKGYHSIYLRYKEATQRFKDGLRSMVPDEIFQGDFVQSFVDAVDYLKDNNITEIPNSLMVDLKLAIRVRRTVAENQFSGSRGDEGHAFFLAALVYCFATLRRLKPRGLRRSCTESDVNSADRKEPEPHENRFASLFLDEEDDEKDDEDDLSLPSSEEPISKPVEPEGQSSSSSSRLTLDELIRGSDFDAAILFLMTLDEIMRVNSEKFLELKRQWRLNQQGDVPPLAIVEKILEASTVSNFGIQYVQFLEQTLIVDYPHMDTLYRLLAVVLLPELTEELTAEVTNVNPNFRPTDAKMFLGDVLERAMRNDSDPVLKDVATKFCKTWKIPTKRVENYYVLAIRLLVRAESSFDSATSKHLILTLAGEAGLRIAENGLLPGFQYIGTSKRSIVMTIRLLQGWCLVMKDDQGHYFRAGFDPSKIWDETNTGLAKSIAHDMDHLLYSEIMPVLLRLCWLRADSKLPYEDELFPLLPLMKSYAFNPEKPVSWAFAFAIQTLLTSIFEVQGDGDVHNIAQVAESSYDLYFKQLSIASQQMKGKGQSTFWAGKTEQINALTMIFALPGLQPCREDMIRAYWNPFCAGGFLGYVTYLYNLRLGSRAIDDLHQLRLVLHLYHALRDVELIQVRPGGILENLATTFESSKAIWDGPKPTRGNFVVRLLIAVGVDIKTAKEISTDVQAQFSTVQLGATKRRTSRIPPRDRLYHSRQKMPIELDKLSKSFRRIMNRDFSDGVDEDYHAPEQKSKPVYDHAARCKDTIDAIYKEQPFLSINMAAMGIYLNLFLRRLSVQINRSTQETAGLRSGRHAGQNGDESQEIRSRAINFAEEILGRLDVLDLTEPGPVLVQVAEFMTEYFDQLDPDLIMYFVSQPSE